MQGIAKHNHLIFYEEPGVVCSHYNTFRGLPRFDCYALGSHKVRAINWSTRLLREVREAARQYERTDDAKLYPLPASAAIPMLGFASSLRLLDQHQRPSIPLRTVGYASRTLCITVSALILANRGHVRGNRPPGSTTL